MPEKGLILRLAEAWDAYWVERRAAKTQTGTVCPPRKWLPTPGNVLFTILFTVSLMTSLLWVQSAGALNLGVISAASASTGTIAYQGRLANTGGQPLTGTYPMIFRFYSAAAGGTPLWEEQWTGANSVQVSDGLFNVMLGSLAPIAQSIVTANSNLFLGITVGTDSEMSPRVQLGTVPFAMQALTVPDGSITKAKLASDVSLVPPDGSITTGKIADGAVTSQKQSATTYFLDDNTYVLALSGETKNLSEFNLAQVPAGDVAVYCSFIASADSSLGIEGLVLLQTSPGGDIGSMPTHIFGTRWDNYVVHGRMQSFGGGNLAVRLRFIGEGGSTKTYFGASNGDWRFGRKCTVIAGL